jgi:glucokinase
MTTDGRSPAPDAHRRLVVGVDIGGSKVAVLVVDRDLEVCGRYTVPTEVGAEDRAARAVTDAVLAGLARAGTSINAVAAVGVGVPGRVEPDTGTVSLAVNLGWHDLALGPQLEAALGVPVRLENDVRAAAAGLHQRRVLGDVDDLAYLSVGTGISAGIVLDGRLHRGPRGLAGEVGHVVIDPDGARCPCGLRGCLETVATGPSVARLASDAIAAGRSSSLDGEPIGASDVYAAARAGDPVAGEIATQAGRQLARAIHQLVMAYDVEVVALGGGVAAAGMAFLGPIEAALDGLRADSPLAREVLRPEIVRLLPADAEAGTWGAVALATSALDGDGRVPLTRREVGDA